MTEQRWTYKVWICPECARQCEDDELNRPRCPDHMHIWQVEEIEVVPAAERDTLREQVRKGEAFLKIGDQMQSALSRVAEWAREQAVPPPYEVDMAALEGLSAVREWTSARAALSTQPPTQEPRER